MEHKRPRGLPDKKTLLKTGHFSDVTLVCGDKTWELHKAIICIASDYFEKALLGEFKEASLNIITIEEFSAVSVGWVIEFIYTGKCAQIELQDKQTCIDTCLELLRMSYYFCITELEAFARQELERYLHEISANIQVWYIEAAPDTEELQIKGEPTDFISPETLNVIAKTVHKSFEDDDCFPNIQDRLVKMVRHTQFWALQDRRFLELLYDVPSFGTKVFQAAMSDARWSLFRVIPKSCGKCMSNVDGHGGHWAEIVPAKHWKCHHTHVEGFCDKPFD